MAIAQKPVLDTEKLIQKPLQKEENQINLNNIDLSKPILTGRVAEEQYLPPGLYGTWQVIQTLVSTNAPTVFKEKVVDIWILQQSKDKVILTNPNTRAESDITVNDVKNSSATFTHSISIKNKQEFEQPTITVQGDKFTGTNVYEIRYYRKKRLIRREQAMFVINATKIAGPTLQIFNQKRKKN